MAVTAGIFALASAGEATASAINSAKNSAKVEIHHRELESIALGNNISNDVIKNDKNLQTIIPFIIAILPEIIKTMPEAAN